MSIQTHHRVCNLCEAMCGIEVTYDPSKTGEQSLAIRPDPKDPFSKGSMCPKAPALASIQFDESRLKYPVKRVGEDWEQISWDEAFDTIEREIGKIRGAHGDDVVAAYLGNPIVHNLGMLLFVKTLTKALGTKNVYSATSMDQLPHHFAGHFMFGHEFRIPVPDIDRTDYMIIMGANPLASNGSIMTSAGVTDRLKHIKGRGGKFVVIDPRKTETAKVASEHHFIRPATDLYFLLAFLHVLYRDNYIKLEALRPHLKGEEDFAKWVKPFSPVAVEGITGIDAADIERLVQEFTTSPTAVIYGRMGLSTQPHGGLCNWLINTINIVSGNFDKAGGMMFPSPAIELARSKKQPLAFARHKSQSRGLNEFYGELPVSGMVDEFAAKDDKKVRAFMTICGNPVLSTPSGGRLEEHLPDIEFMFSIDNYINETTRHANIILPTPTGLEIDHYDMIFHTISVSNNAKFSEALFPIEEGRLYDWQVLKELIGRFSKTGLDLYTRLATPRRIVNFGLMLGQYGKLSHPKRWFSGLSLAKVLKSEHGIRLSPMVPRVPEGLITDDKKINLSPDVYVSRLKEITNTEFPQLQKTLNARDDDELIYFGRRHVSTNNSWMHQYRKLSKSKMVRCTAMIHPEDAVRLKIGDGDDIEVASRIGKIRIPAEVTPDMVKGGICIPHGFGHNRKGTRVPVASEKAGVSVNDITDHMKVDPVTGNAAFSGQVFKVKPLVEMREVKNVTGKPITILFGTRTGNAESLANETARLAESHGMVATVTAMDAIEPDGLASIDRALIICSTYGEGDMPDNAQELWDAVNADKPDLSKLNYSVLALGDHAYETFCQAGRDWDAGLEALGAKCAAPRVDCGVDYTQAAQDWADEALPAIGVLGDQETVVTQPSRANFRAPLGTSKDNPMVFTVTEHRSLTSENSSKETYHYALAAEGAGALYQEGGILNIMPENDPALINEITAELKLDLSKDQDLAEKFKTQYDIRTPSDDLVAMAKLKKGEDIEGLDVLDILRKVPKRQRNLKRFLECLRPLMPRAYSIASSPVRNPDSVDLCVATVRYKIGKRGYDGVGSAYLQDRVPQGGKVKGYFVPNKSFTLPEDTNQPVIMIGPGTGIAPFRGFLQAHKDKGYSGPTWLFFGERQAATDFLYQDELKAFQNDGTLSRLDTAFSRDQKEKVYVQTRMLEQGAEIFKWLQDGAAVYVCGDAKSMAHDVDLALREIIKTHGKISDELADEFINQMQQSRRYLKDVY